MTENLLDRVNDDLEQDPQQNYWEALTGPGAKFDRTKYASEQELKEAISKSNYHADRHIKIVERTKDEQREDFLKLKQEYDARESLKEYLDKMAITQQPLNRENNLNSNEEKLALNTDDFKSLVKQEVVEFNKETVRQQNFKLVSETLQERLGANYANVLNKQIQDLGLNADYVNDLARTSPKAFFKTFGLDKQASEDTLFNTPPRNERLSNSFNTKGDKRSWSFYQKMRKENPKQYQSKETARQMERDYAELGADFEDGNFHEGKYNYS